MYREISKRKRVLKGEVALPASKSLCNRALLIGALGGGKVKNISSAKDSRDLHRLLRQYEKRSAASLAGTAVYDAGAGGTTYRFFLAFLATRPGQQILTGSKRMQQRPIGPLVDALRQMGANISYLKRDGFPPVRIGRFTQPSGPVHVSLSANISSQYLSALLLIAPGLGVDFKLEARGEMVSRPYLDMTLGLMKKYGVNAKVSKNVFFIPAGSRYRPMDYEVEADWSAASYFYALAALSEEADLFLPGLQQGSLQGDAVLAKWMRLWGVASQFEEGGVRIFRFVNSGYSPPLEMDFFRQPDLAQTFAVLAAALGHPLRLSGLQTLRIKETDRVVALKRELSKVGVEVGISSSRADCMIIGGKAQWTAPPVFDTYEDHRMAMSLSVLSMLGDVVIRDPQVVEKSFPGFFSRLDMLGRERS